MRMTVAMIDDRVMDGDRTIIYHSGRPLIIVLIMINLVIL